MMIVSRRGLALALVVACLPVAASVAVAADIQPAAATSEAQRSFVYRCEDGTSLTATFSPPEQPRSVADLVFADGKTVALPQAISADGGRYTQGDIEFWIKGNGATLTIAGKSTQCETSD